MFLETEVSKKYTPSLTSTSYEGFLALVKFNNEGLQFYQEKAPSQSHYKNLLWLSIQI